MITHNDKIHDKIAPIYIQCNDDFFEKLSHYFLVIDRQTQIKILIYIKQNFKNT